MLDMLQWGSPGLESCVSSSSSPTQGVWQPPVRFLTPTECPPQTGPCREGEVKGRSDWVTQGRRQIPSQGPAGKASE